MTTLAELKTPRCREAKGGISSASARQAMERIRNSPYLAIRALECRELDDEIHISGSVSSFFLKQMAQECLLSIRGMGRIVNEVVVEDGKRHGRGRSALTAVFLN